MNLPRITTRDRTLATVTVSLLVACFLSVVRGGFDTVPFIVFTVGTFFLGLLGQVLFRRESLAAIEARLRHLPFATAVRYAVVFCALVALLVWSGPIMTSGGFAGWLIALLVWLASPAIICPLAPRCPILFGILAAGCTAFSLAVENSRLYSSSRDIQWSHAFSNVGTLAVVWCIAAALSLLVSIPVYVQRRTA